MCCMFAGFLSFVFIFTFVPHYTACSTVSNSIFSNLCVCVIFIFYSLLLFKIGLPIFSFLLLLLPLAFCSQLVYNAVLSSVCHCDLFIRVSRSLTHSLTRSLFLALTRCTFASLFYVYSSSLQLLATLKSRATKKRKNLLSFSPFDLHTEHTRFILVYY